VYAKIVESGVCGHHLHVAVQFLGRGNLSLVNKFPKSRKKVELCNLALNSPLKIKALRNFEKSGTTQAKDTASLNKKPESSANTAVETSIIKPYNVLVN
jgi:hypothetical protein